MYLLVSSWLQLHVSRKDPAGDQARACALSGDTHAKNRSHFQENVYSWSTVYCHSPSKIVGVSMMSSFAATSIVSALRRGSSCPLPSRQSHCSALICLPEQSLVSVDRPHPPASTPSSATVVFSTRATCLIPNPLPQSSRSADVPGPGLRGAACWLDRRQEGAVGLRIHALPRLYLHYRQI